ncbi:carboxylating nicotinate-nucleotide diphosphorylase [Marinoscillum furvescens]|uniref:Probable nicotinate-nucleotide pyrophosphorylase [carboxylating] n=1 Tax=Marinoscillum furvescens DSM 4134 TaxID=1122208 RepID=A0A3D9L449_MARFU|nr:carboxylating nicotinate-nucleotide diphosphorylase [Marinoscillum furvescens]RED98844.1 nicotinate-nucleotide pyrophosphorylase [carboxylating] [Marinoscillum furvescens DSM 4134]
MAKPYLTEQNIRYFIKTALSEDIGDGDHSSLGSIPKDQVSHAQLLIKDNGVLAGLTLAERIFHYVDKSIEIDFKKKDGDFAYNGEVGLVVKGNAQAILSAERLVLNCMQRMSGIATYTHKICELIKGHKARLLDTRKTTPNFRLPEKWAVAIGGGVNHRFGLYDMVMLKDNHVDYAGGINPAIISTVEYLKANNLDLKIEVEVRNLAELEEVIETGHVHRVMLDNMLPSDIREAVHMVRGRMETEASGGITEKNIGDIAETGVDYISVGALTHSYKSLDISLKAIK